MDFRRRRTLGFTLMELIVAMTIMAMLASVGIVGYRRQTKVSKEAVLKENLWQINHALEQHKADRGRYPASLQALRDLGYFREIPVDPMTNSRDTWQVENEPPDPDNPESEGGIFRVRSGSTDMGEDQRPYNEW